MRLIFLFLIQRLFLKAAIEAELYYRNFVARFFLDFRPLMCRYFRFFAVLWHHGAVMSMKLKLKQKISIGII